MSLPEANQRLQDVDCRDADAVALALTERARSIAEFAASASPELLRATHTAGEDLRERLEFAQIEVRRELDRMSRLTRGLSSNLDEHQPDRITCFG